MTEVTPDLARILVGLAETFGTRLTETRIRMYASALADFSPDELQLAAERAVIELKYFPQVSELRAFVEGTMDDTALLAWTSLSRAASKVGAWQSLVVDDWRAAVAVTDVFGSWPLFCASDDTPTKRIEFIAAFKRAARGERRSSMRLPGLAEATGPAADEHKGVTSVGLLRADGSVDVVNDVPSASLIASDNAIAWATKRTALKKH